MRLIAASGSIMRDNEPPIVWRDMSPKQESHWVDIAAVIGITLLSIVVADYFNLNEALYALTRSGERFQIDELPVGMLVLLACLVWLSWRRYAQAHREIHARRQVEERLTTVLEENRKLNEQTLRVQEAERKHLARELHDELGQYLNAIKLHAVSIIESGGVDAELVVDDARRIVGTVDYVHVAVTDMIARLRPAALDELGLAAAIEHCVDYWRQRLPDTRFDLSVSGTFDDLSEPLKLALFRLIQEGLTNIYKHADARRTDIGLTRMQSSTEKFDEVCLTVADDGCGMNQAVSATGFGLLGMRERVERLGGTFQLVTNPGQGLRFSVTVPVMGEIDGQE
jgi:two-component system, NarL family, sensor histidine kinase UhpB